MDQDVERLVAEVALEAFASPAIEKSPVLA
jgi:hypothetical protein